MNLLLITFIFHIGLIPSANIHEVPIAIFKLEHIESKVKLDIIIDAKDLLNEIESCTSKDSISIKMLETYFQNNLGILLNGLPVHIQINDFTKESDHLKISGILSKNIKLLTNLEIRNTCLINVSNHSNIIKLRGKHIERDFRMHKDRTELIIQL